MYHHTASLVRIINKRAGTNLGLCKLFVSRPVPVLNLLWHTNPAARTTEKRITGVT